MSEFGICPYLDKRKFRQEYFFASTMSADEFNKLLQEGWRRFGAFFFRPQCDTCHECIPIRVKVDEFRISKSLRRIINKNKETKVVFNTITYSDEIYEVYREHSIDRFGQKATKEHFIDTFFYNSVCAMQSEYYVNNKLAGVGFFDISKKGLSSVYFFFKTDFEHLCLGTYGAIKEIEYTKQIGLKHYYLGYYIKECKRMSYKARFKEHELYDWQKNKWIPGT